MLDEVAEVFGAIKRSIITSSPFQFANCFKVHPITECLTGEKENASEAIKQYLTVFLGITSTLPVGEASGHLPRLIPFSRQQADSAVINEEEVTCQRRHFSHFVLNVIYVIASAGSRCPPSRSILFISGRRNSQKSKTNKDNMKRQTSSRRTEQI